MAEDILGISGHLDISDIDRSINEIIENLDKIGVKTDVLSKRMSDAMREIANSTDDAATKQKRAMDVLSQGIAEAKAALANYPEQIHLAKDAMQQTEVATTNLEKELAKLNSQLQNSVVGSSKYDELKNSIAGVEQQIHNNTATYQAQLATVQQMEAGYNGLVSMLGLANTATVANAAAHGAVTATITAEAAAHAYNAQKITEETQKTEVQAEKRKEVTAAQMEAYNDIISYATQAANLISEIEKDTTGDKYTEKIAKVEQLIEKIRELYEVESQKTQSFVNDEKDKDSSQRWNEYITSADYAEAVQKQIVYGNALKAINDELLELKKNHKEFSDAAKQAANAIQNTSSKKSVEELTAELQRAEEEYKKLIGLSEEAGRLRTLFQEHLVASQYNQGLITEEDLSRILKAKENVSKLKEELSEAKREAKEAANELNSNNGKSNSFVEQWKNVNELHSKIQSLTQEIKTYKEEYDKLSEKPGFDEQSKKVQELLDKIKELKRQLAEARNEMQNENGAGGLLGKFKNWLTDVMTGNGKFQASLVDMKKALSGLVAPFSAATAGAMAFARALWALAATPLGAILTTLGFALKAVHTWFTKSAEGQRVFAKISAYLGSLMSSLTDLAVKVGHYLYKAFQDPQNPIRQLGTNLFALVIEPLKVIVNLLNTVIKTFNGIGNVAKALKSGDWGAFHEAMSDAKKNFSEAEASFTAMGEATAKTIQAAIQGVQNVIESAGLITKDAVVKGWNTNLLDVGGNILDKAKKSWDLAGQQLDAEKQLAEAKVKEKELEIEIAEEREKIYTLTGKEKDAQIELVKGLMKQKYDGQIAAQSTLLRIQQERNALHTKSLESYAKEREAQSAVYTLEAQRAASTRMLVRMQQANLKSMANAGKKDARQGQTIADAQTHLEDIIYKNSIARAKFEQQIEQKITDARIAAMKDGAEKVMAEKNRQLEKELEQLDEQRKAAVKAERARQKAEFEAQEKIIKARGGKTKQWSDKEIDQTAIDSINAQYETLRKIAVQRQQKDEAETQRKAMREYLKEFGDMQRQRMAISEEYNEKIVNAEALGNIAEVQALKKKLEDTLSSLDMERIKNSINWEVVFNDIDKLSTEALENLREKLKKAINEGDVSPENAKILSEKILEIENKISDNTNIWSSLLPALKERERITQMVASAEDEVARNMKKQVTLQEELDKKRTNLQNLVKLATSNATNPQGISFTSDMLNLSTDEFLKALHLDKQSELGNQVAQAFEKLKLTSTDLGKTEEQLAAAIKQRQYANDILSGFKGKGVTGGISDIISTAVKSGGGGAFGIVNVVGQNIQSMAEFSDKIGLAGTDFGDAVHGFAEGVGGFQKAISALSNGDIFGAVNGVIDGVVGFGKSITSIFGVNWSGGNEKEHAEENKRLLDSQQALTNSINRLKEYFDKANGIKAVEISDQIVKDQERLNATLMERWINDMHYSSAHGSNAYQWTSDDAMWGIVNWANAVLKEHDKAYGDLKHDANGNVEQLESNDWWAYTKLSPEAIAAIRDVPELWRIITEQGDYRWVYDSLSEYADQAGKVSEQIEKLAENLTLLSDTKLHDLFHSELMDMKKDAKDFGKDFSEILMKAVMDTQIGNEMDSELKAWRNKLATKMRATGGKLTDADVKELRAEWNNIVQEGIELRDEMARVTGYDKTYQKQQKATANSIQNISYEQADSLVGIGLAAQIIMEQELAEVINQGAMLMNIETHTQNISAQVVSINEGVRTMLETQDSMNNHLAAIRANTNVLPEVRDEIVRVRRLVEEQ